MRPYFAGHDSLYPGKMEYVQCVLLMINVNITKLRYVSVTYEGFQ